MKKYLLAAMILAISLETFSQPYMEAKTRHRFAQLNTGMDIRSFITKDAKTFEKDVNGNLTAKHLNPQTDFRLIVGGTHFWGHSDFYIAFPVVSIGKSGFFSSVETGAKIYPWRITNNKARPFAGISWMTSGYDQDDGVLSLRHSFPLMAGLTYNTKGSLFELCAGYIEQNSFDYFISKTEKVKVNTHPIFFSFGYKRMIETTISAEKSWESGYTKLLTDTLEKLGLLNGFTISTGPSSAIYLSSSAHNALATPYLGDHKFANVFLEVGLGYYIHRPDLQFNLVYRKVRSELSAFETLQTAKRIAFTAEGYKFLFDYHGFVPFAGGAVSHEWLEVDDRNPVSGNNTATFSGFRPGFVFGWDIRPNRVQSWYLRTNLRWFPNLNIRMQSGSLVSLDQLEINFIQLVVFPGRMF